MIGRRPGYVTSQGLILADHFEKAGYEVITASDATNRYVRLLDILATIIRHGRRLDVVCVEVYAGPSFVVEDLASVVAKFFRRRIVMVLHGGSLPEFMDRHPSWARRVLRRADLIVAPSPFLARAAGRQGFSARVIPNIIDISKYPFRHRCSLRPHFLWMRAFHPFWNPEMAIRVFAQIHKKLPHAKLVMAGQDKGLQSSIERLAADLNLGGSVRFPGFLNMEGKIREAAEADIFLNTNRVDNMPVAVVEACAMGLPVVSTSVGGVPDLLTDGETGLLVGDNDIDGMERAILRLLQDSELAARISAGGHQLAQRSAWERVRPEWERAFRGRLDN